MFFIVVMIASLGAVGLGSFGSGGRTAAPISDEATPEPAETPSGLLSFPDGPAQTIEASKAYKAIVKTNKGDIEIELFSDAPQAVNSFAFLAGNGFYDNKFFFYVDQGFAAQAGDPTCDAGAETLCTGVGGPGYGSPLPVEANSHTHEQWAVVAPAMIEGQEVHGSQFRILFQPDPRLDGKETVFGRVMTGQEILESLPNFVPCSVADAEGCDPQLDVSRTLVIQEVIVQPA